MSNSTPTQLRFDPSAGFTIRADFEGGGLSSDLGSLLLRGVDQQIGLTQRLAAALDDRRHPSYIRHSVQDVLIQRIFQMGSSYEDGNDSNYLRHDPMFHLGADRMPFDPEDALASGATISRFEHAATRRDVYRASRALVEQFTSGYTTPPKALVIDLDHSEDKAHGQQPLAFYNGDYRSTCYHPLFVFDGRFGALITAVLRPGKRPTGAENAMIMKRVLKFIRKRFPDTDFIFGLGGDARLLRSAESTLKRARALYAQRQTFNDDRSARLYEEFEYAAGTWNRSHRVILKAEVMAQGDNPRFVVTSMNLPDPHTIYTDLYGLRGNAENFIKHLKCDLVVNRTSCTTFLANCMRLVLHCAAYVLHQQLRTEALQHTELASVQPASVILKLFKVATQVKQYKDRVILHRPSAYPFKHLLWQLTERLLLSKSARFNTS